MYTPSPYPSSTIFYGGVDKHPAAIVRVAYPGDTWKRLGKVKKKYDPTNLFHMNQNILPKQ
ncbi:MAG: BBE domain-containing protein [Anaerolineales bacterium]